MLNDLGPDDGQLGAAVRAYTLSPDHINYVELLRAVEHQRQDLIRTLNWAPQGTSALIAMRADLLELSHDDEDLKIVDYDFLHLLTSWFNRGFLELRRIDWNTPAFI